MWRISVAPPLRTGVNASFAHVGWCEDSSVPKFMGTRYTFTPIKGLLSSQRRCGGSFVLLMKPGSSPNKGVLAGRVAVTERWAERSACARSVSSRRDRQCLLGHIKGVG